MRSILIYFTAACLAVSLLSGCTMPYGGPTEHTFLQSRENVVKVEICTNSEAYRWTRGRQVTSLQPLAELSSEEIDAFWNELSAFPALEMGHHPGNGCGDLLFVVSYANGQQELVGYGEVGVLNADGTFDKYRYYVLDNREQLAKLFAKYADPALLRANSQSFRAFYD